MKPCLDAYLARLDAHLAAVPSRAQRMRLIDDERHRVDRLERALADWAARTRGETEPPTRFSAFDLAILHGELSLRLEATRAPLLA
ncbi:MAG TPA: hypothetical protein VK446_11295 [Methylocystis sp.]|nr:hypothetical protein [Methylocystis sp.]